jgi:hypothetical protein
MHLTLNNLITRVSHFVRNILVSILLPGFVVLAEVWSILHYPSLPSPVTKIRYIWLVIVLVIAYLSYVIGYALRQVTFVLAEFDLRHPFSSVRAIDTPLPYRTRRWGERYYRREAFECNYRLLRDSFGQDAVDRALKGHPLEAVYQFPTGGNAGTPTQQPASNTASSPDYREVFHYCKTWLLLNAPELGTERMELEFNAQFAAVPPLILLPGVVSVHSHSLVALLALEPVALTVAGLLYRRGNHMRHAEVFNVLRNLMFAKWLSETRIAPTAGGVAESPGRPSATIDVGIGRAESTD